MAGTRKSQKRYTAQLYFTKEYTTRNQLYYALESMLKQVKEGFSVSPEEENYWELNVVEKKDVQVQEE